ncbi:MAG: hypothetical protein IAX21_02180 [Candidatus Bathyarchaeota archaeon]|nr:hypothetical protein [Candidatus Bathyarchaeum tardum]WGM90213.1 MAG: hypothetical protein NUK63_03600 [Candidatus Bathyarchaeum tardum]WNZ29701.1 MAG: hypothetical protein IAX21_02180 [Candidatus Bathyarchaeota archaeon]
MKFKKLFALIVCVFLFTMSFSGIVWSQSEQTKNVYTLAYGGLLIDIVAPVQSSPGETITITITTEAVTQVQVDVEYIDVLVYGLINAKDEISLAEITHIQNMPLTFHEANYQISVPNDISPGLIYGIITSEWDFMGSHQKITPSGFALTYIQNIELEELRAEYNQLNATYHNSLKNYTNLESDLSVELDSTRNLMYIFVATTVVASITVIVLLMRKPKKIWI